MAKTASSGSFKDVSKLLPTGVYTLASLVANAIAPDGRCSHTDRVVFIVIVLVILGLWSGLVAAWLRTTGNRERESRPFNARHEVALTVGRALGVICAFVALMMLTAPGNSCLFPRGSAEEVAQTRIPTSFSSFILSGIVWAADIASRIPGLVTGQSKSSKVMEQKALTLTTYLLRYLPTRAYTSYSVVAAYMIPRAGSCNDTQRASFIALITIVAIAVAILSAIEDWQDDEQLVKYWWVQALLACAVFVGLALLTPPGSTCLFPSAQWFEDARRYTMVSLAVLATIVTVILSQSPLQVVMVDSDDRPTTIASLDA